MTPVPNSTDPCCKRRLILASASPRRRRLLEEVGVRFETIPSGIEETFVPGEQPPEYARRLAAEKATSVAREFPGRWVLGADTVVWFVGDADLPRRILEKPRSTNEALRMLRLLSGRTHRVTTGVAFAQWIPGRGSSVPEEERYVFSTTSLVSFRELSEREIREYIQTGEPMDKAGAYAIQGNGSRFVDRYTGSWTNIVGLPMEEVTDWLTVRGFL